MPIIDWSDTITIAQLSDEPMLSEDLDGLLRRLDRNHGPPPDVIIDLQNVRAVNSSTLAQLLRVRKRLLDADRRLRLCAVNTETWSVLLMTALDRVFEFTEDVPTALASLQIEP